MIRRTAIAAVLTVVVSLACVIPARAVVSCTFSAASGVAFGNYDVFSVPPTLSNGTLIYSCTGVSAITPAIVKITLTRGLHSGAFPNRNMANGANLLGYNLYLDAGFTMIWGNATGGTFIYGPVTITNSSPVTVTAFGRIPASQNVRFGSYTDTITATMSF